MLLLAGLDYEFSLLPTPSGATHQLAEQLQRLLIRPEILHPPNGICSNHRHQTEAFKIKSFTYHLGPDKDICLPLRKILYCLFLSLFALGNICIITGN